MTEAKRTGRPRKAAAVAPVQEVPVQANPEPVVVADPVVTPDPEPVVVADPVVTPDPEPVVVADPVVTPDPEPVVVADPVVTPDPEPVVVADPVVTPDPEPDPLSISAVNRALRDFYEPITRTRIGANGTVVIKCVSEIQYRDVLANLRQLDFGTKQLEIITHGRH